MGSKPQTSTIVSVRGGVSVGLAGILRKSGAGYVTDYRTFGLSFVCSHVVITLPVKGA